MLDGSSANNEISVFLLFLNLGDQFKDKKSIVTYA